MNAYLRLLILLGSGIIIAQSCNEVSNMVPSVTEKSVAAEGNRWQLGPFEKVDSINPILQPTATQQFTDPITNEIVQWEGRNVLNPSALVKDGKVYMIYRAQDEAMTSRLGLAVSEDGLHFKKEAAPIFYPDNDDMKSYEWEGGVEDPRIVESEDGRYILTYSSYDGKTARLCIASSTDLRFWTKHGLVLGEGKYKDQWSKAGAIVSRREAGKIIATKINGKYWMYFGDTNLFMASSDDLIKWEVIENSESKKMISVLHPRPGYFDSRLVEPGPYALIQDEGILLIYNASNAENNNDVRLPKFTYAAGQALFDKNLPYRLIDRSDE
ncbi:MAG: putative GH43/DUF377 family glycosyl hydrolase, partial [Saprospiraceae bacterium]